MQGSQNLTFSFLLCRDVPEDMAMRFMYRPLLFNNARPARGPGGRSCAWLVVALLSSGCSVAPIEETRSFSKAFAAVDGASQPLLDDLAMAERRQGRENAEIKAKKDTYQGACKGILWAKVDATSGYIEGFCLDDAPYFSELADPPATQAFRHGIRLIGDYSEVLLFLAEGRNLDETSAQVQALGQNIAALMSVASGPGAAAGLTSVLGALDPIIRDAAQRRNIDEMKRLVLSGAPLLKKLIQSLREAAPEVFNTLIFQSVKGVTSPEALDNKTVARAYLDRITAYRTAVSNYVMLLGDLELSFDQLVAAFQQPRNAVSLAIIAERSGRLSANAEAWRKVYSTLRAGGSQ
jgi:hypothetical protein